MENENVSKKYTWDIAISLCKQDIEFAKKLVAAINPSLKVFFYEDKQEEIIGKSGPEVFARTFKEQSRVVVILSRKEWSESFYTDIERNAIIDRTAVKNEGYQFLIVIPMIQGEIPLWYPSTKIYASPFGFSVEELARFIEFKVAEEGGIVEPVTVEDRYQNLLHRIDEKKSIISLQESKNAIEDARNEIKILKECFNIKSNFLQRKIIDSVSGLPFTEHTYRGRFGINEYLLECQIVLPDEMYHHIVTTQDFCVAFKLFKIFEEGKTEKTIEQEERLFYFTPQLKGWSLPHLYEQATNRELIVLFRNRDNRKYYDLTKPINTLTLVDDWFQKLLSVATQRLERYI
ncbi:MAG TPA: hypothetical protein VF487_12400 [Chitinophagaceae bacterium]